MALSNVRFPWGWFVVSFSSELKAGEVKPLRYFGQDLVLFRTQEGAAKILDAFCPHMGAHLGYGGIVEGGDLKCPFHAWKFDGDGRCTDVPYAKKIPPKARVECWPVQERNGMIFVWHDPEKGPPRYEIPIMPELETTDWTPWNHSVLRVQTHPREIVENVVDIGHFIPVHGTHIEKFSNEFDGHMATQINSGTAYPLGGGKDHYSLRATYYGPGYQATQMNGVLHSLLVNAHTPVDAGSLDLRFAVSLRITESREKTDMFAQKYIDNLRNGFLQDIRIWEHKAFREVPVLCDGDGPIIRLRKWYQQFYAAAA